MTNIKIYTDIHNKRFPVDIVYDDSLTVDKIEKDKAENKMVEHKINIICSIILGATLLIAILFFSCSSDFTYEEKIGYALGFFMIGFFATGFTIARIGEQREYHLLDSEGRYLPEYTYHNNVFGKKIVETNLCLGCGHSIDIKFSIEDQLSNVTHTTVTIQNVVEKKNISKVEIDVNKNIAYIPWVSETITN